MKSCTITIPADTQLDLHCLPISCLLEENLFTTVPMSVARPVTVRTCENDEEVYTSFEEAISERAACVSRQLSSLSLVKRHAAGKTDIFLLHIPRFIVDGQNFWQMRRQAIALVCLGLSLLMVGFDLMGLLVLTR